MVRSGRSDAGWCFAQAGQPPHFGFLSLCTHHDTYLGAHYPSNQSGGLSEICELLYYVLSLDVGIQQQVHIFIDSEWSIKNAKGLQRMSSHYQFAQLSIKLWSQLCKTYGNHCSLSWCKGHATNVHYVTLGNKFVDHYVAKGTKGEFILFLRWANVIETLADWISACNTTAPIAVEDSSDDDCSNTKPKLKLFIVAFAKPVSSVDTLYVICVDVGSTRFVSKVISHVLAFSLLEPARVPPKLLFLLALVLVPPELLFLASVPGPRPIPIPLLLLLRMPWYLHQSLSNGVVLLQTAQVDSSVWLQLSHLLVWHLRFCVPLPILVLTS